MPDYFAHSIIAQQIYEKLEKDVRAQITDLPLYRLGAQGGDVFFMYTLKTGPKNLGVRMHHLNAYNLFCDLLKGNKSYAAGFATHYALDATLHPAIYAFVDANRGKFTHLSFENDLGLYCSKYYSVPRKIMPKGEVVGATSAIYDTIKNVYDNITVTGVERCLKRYFTYTRIIYKHKRNKYKYDYDFATLNGALDDAVIFGCEVVKSVLCGEIDKDLFDKSFLEK